MRFNLFITFLLLLCTSIAYAEFQGGVLIAESGGHGLSAGIGPEGQPAFSFYHSDRSISFVFSDQNNYITETVFENAAPIGPGPEFESSFIYFNDQPHIFFRDNVSGNLIHAYKIENDWQTEILDATAGYPHATSCDQNICVCYQDIANGRLRLAIGDTANWSTETVDAGPNEVGSYCYPLQHSSGDIFIAYYDATDQLTKIAQGSTGDWTLTGLSTAGNAAWGFWPHLLEIENGNLELRASAYKLFDTSSADVAYFYSAKSGNNNWTAPQQAWDSYVGGYPTATITDNNRAFSFIRYLRFSALFGEASYISYLREMPDSSILSGSLGGFPGCLPFIQYLNSFSSGTNVYLAYYMETDNCNNAPNQAIMLYSLDAAEDEDEDPDPDPDPDPAPDPDPDPGQEPDPNPSPSASPSASIPPSDYDLDLAGQFNKKLGQFIAELNIQPTPASSCTTALQFSRNQSFRKVIYTSPESTAESYVLFSNVYNKPMLNKKAKPITLFVRAKMSCLNVEKFSEPYSFTPKQNSRKSAKPLKAWLRALWGG